MKYFNEKFFIEANKYQMEFELHHCGYFDICKNEYYIYLIFLSKLRVKKLNKICGKNLKWLYDSTETVRIYPNI
jgi:hypothetical protein